MGTITSRKRKDNSMAYTVQMRINRDERTVYQESQTFDRKQVAGPGSSAGKHSWLSLMRLARKS